MYLHAKDYTFRTDNNFILNRITSSTAIELKQGDVRRLYHKARMYHMSVLFLSYNFIVQYYIFAFRES